MLARTAHTGTDGVTLTHAFYHSDKNGNITYLVKPDKTIGASYVYDPYGRTIGTPVGSLASANVYRFSSKEWMASSAMYYYGYRFYDPFIQRWLNGDPVFERGGINLYRSFDAHPTGAVDPFGESIIGKVCVLGAKQIAKRMGRIGMKESVDAVKAGEYVIAKSRNAAKDIATRAGDGKPPIHEIDKKSGAPHYHPAGRCGGHVFFTIAGGLTCSYWASGRGRLAEAVAEGIDAINPLYGRNSFPCWLTRRIAND